MLAGDPDNDLLSRYLDGSASPQEQHLIESLADEDKIFAAKLKELSGIPEDAGAVVVDGTRSVHQWGEIETRRRTRKTLVGWGALALVVFLVFSALVAFWSNVSRSEVLGLSILEKAPTVAMVVEDGLAEVSGSGTLDVSYSADGAVLKFEAPASFRRKDGGVGLHLVSGKVLASLPEETDAFGLAIQTSYGSASASDGQYWVASTEDGMSVGVDRGSGVFLAGSSGNIYEKSLIMGGERGHFDVLGGTYVIPAVFDDRYPGGFGDGERVLHHWAFEKSAGDKFGRARPRGLSDDIVFPEGKTGYSIGLSGEVGVRVQTLTLPPQFSVSGWVRVLPERPGHFHTILTNQGKGHSGSGFRIGVREGPAGGGVLALETTSGREVSVTASSTGTFPLGRWWVHVLVQVDRPDGRAGLWINGRKQEVSETADVDLGFRLVSPVLIGISSGSKDGLHGRIDELRVHRYHPGAETLW